MAYYAAVISLKQTILRLLNSSQISILPSARDIIEFAYEKVNSFQQVLQKLGSSSHNSSKMVDPLPEQIGEAANKLEDAIESHISDQFLSRSERFGNEGSNLLILSLDSDDVLKQEIHYFADMVRKMEEACSKPLDLELSNALPEEDDADSSRIDFGGTESNMVGLSDQFSLLKERLINNPINNFVVSISGMAGIGKTILARKIYQDPEISSYFDYRLWVRIGQRYQPTKIMLSILAQLDDDVDNIEMEGEEKLANYLLTSLESKRYLIVLDDVWQKEDWFKIQYYLPFSNRSRVLLITRLQHIANHVSALNNVAMRFLNEEESWCLLRQKVFGEESCPFQLAKAGKNIAENYFQLEQAGKKIAENCDGLPLLIIAVANLLSKTEKTLEYWSKVADKKDNLIFREANDKISIVLLRSYKYLPLDLKACFLYMGVFPLKCIIPASKLFNLWNAEDLFELDDSPNAFLGMLVSSNLVLAHLDASSPGQVKTCSLHSSFWHACVKQSREEKFLLVISSSADTSKGVKSPRRLCIYNNVLFGIKEVCSSIESISSARSLICSGPYHQYPVPICFRLRLLKVLDFLSVRLYKFPIEVLKLIQLRYLALTYNGNVPASISKLWNLEYLIVRRHLNIKLPRDLSYMHVEIWNLQKLKHLQVMGSCLPYLYDALLPNLLKLSDMSAHSCTKEIFERIPNLEKLGIQIELAPDVAEPLSCFDHLSHINKLKSLKCVIVNPNPAKPQIVTPPTYITSFPIGLKKLSLSGFGYPWEYMHLIVKLPYLKVLKLRSYAFRGLEWIIHGDDFPRLNFLLLEGLDLVHFRSHDRCFPVLHNLIIRHCYKLKEIPLKFGWFTEIKLIDSPLVANYVRENQLIGTSLHIHSSWEDKKHKA